MKANWEEILKDRLQLYVVNADFDLAYNGSTIVAVTVTISSVLFGSMAGYAFAKLRFAGRELRA